MNSSIHERFERLQVRELLAEYNGLRIAPSSNGYLVITGTLRFQASSSIHEVIEDQYELEMSISSGFPDEEPFVRETAQRIPKDFHKLKGDFLCLGSPTEIRMKMKPTLPAFVELFVIPYLYGYSYFEKYEVLPFGELAHGVHGIRQHLANLFCAPTAKCPEEFLRLAGMTIRNGNKLPCPCGSGKRLGKCHNRRVNELRQAFGRRWFRAEHTRICALYEL